MSRKRKIIFFIPAKVQILDLTGPVQVFYEANSYGAEYDLQFVSIQNNLMSAGGLPFGLISHYSKAVLNPGDYIFIPGAEMDYLDRNHLKNKKSFLNGFDLCRSVKSRSVRCVRALLF